MGGRKVDMDKEKGAAFSRNPLIYLVGWRSLNWFYNYLFYMC